MSAPRKKTSPLSPVQQIARKRIAELRRNGGDDRAAIIARAEDLTHDNFIAWFLAEDARVLDPDGDDD